MYDQWRSQKFLTGGGGGQSAEESREISENSCFNFNFVFQILCPFPRGRHGHEQMDLRFQTQCQS